MQQEPPPYSDMQSSTSAAAAYPTQLQQQPLPPKAGVGAPMQAVYVANSGYAMNPGYPSSSGGVVQPSLTTTTTRTVVQQQPPAVFLTPGIQFHELPVSLQCSVCRVQIVTATEHYPGGLSWLACCGLAAIGCVLGCCLIPFCVDDMKDVTHSCPNCKTVLGVYHRL